MIINAGLKAIIYASGYADPMAVEMLEEAGVALIRFNGDDQEKSE